jgi:hypothetical protein
VGLVYWLLLKDLPIYAIRQCMPYFGDDQPHHFPPSVTIPYYFTQHWLTLTHALTGWAKSFSASLTTPMAFVVLVAQTANMLVHIILHAATLLVAVLFLTKRYDFKAEKTWLLSMFVLGVFFVLNFHEFVVSGVWYRTYWSLPFIFMFHFMVIESAARRLPRLMRGLIYGVFFIVILFGFLASYFSTQAEKHPLRLLQGPHGQVYLGNEPEWTATVNAASAFLTQHLKPGESFLALPYDCIYYYLTNTPSPTRQLIFFDHIKIPREQELSIIRELENKNVAYVLMSNRIASSETGLGIFGKTYCPLISAYIGQNYVPTGRQGGNWQEEPGWGHNHGVLILKRK